LPIALIIAKRSKERRLVSANWMRRRQQVVAEFLRRNNSRISIDEDHNTQSSSQSNAAEVRRN
jgi:hypothetical protein